MSHRNPYYPLLLRLLSTLVFASMFALLKLGAKHGIAIPEIMFWRQAVTVPVILAGLWWTKNLHQLRTQRLGSHARRSLVGMTNMAMTFTAATLLPLAVSTTLGFTTALFAVLISAFYFHHTVGKWRWLAVLLGFLGVVIIANPSGGNISILGATLAIGGGLVVAIINYLIRDLARTENTIASVFYFGLFGTLITTPGLLLTMQSHSLFEWSILIGLGLTGVIGQSLLAASLRHGAVVSLVVIDYAMLIWATLFDWLLWQHLPQASLWLGAPAIIAAGIIIAWREHLRHKTAPAVLET